MRLYLSGPMTGYPDANMPAFNAAAAALRRRGFDVVNPAEIKVELQEPSADDTAAHDAFWKACLRADIKALCDCEAIALMPGWERSKGAHLELHIAHRIGLEVHYVDDLLATSLPVREAPHRRIDCAMREEIHVTTPTITEAMTKAQHSATFTRQELQDALKAATGKTALVLMSLVAAAERLEKQIGTVIHGKA